MTPAPQVAVIGPNDPSKGYGYLSGPGRVWRLQHPLFMKNTYKRLLLVVLLGCIGGCEQIEDALCGDRQACLSPLPSIVTPDEPTGMTLDCFEDGTGGELTFMTEQSAESFTLDNGSHTLCLPGLPCDEPALVDVNCAR